MNVHWWQALETFSALVANVTLFMTSTQDGRPVCVLLKDRKRVMWDSCSKLVLGLNLQLILVTISDKICIYVWASVAQCFFALTHHKS